jgi:hypothetical protein
MYSFFLRPAVVKTETDESNNTICNGCCFLHSVSLIVCSFFTITDIRCHMSTPNGVLMECMKRLLVRGMFLPYLIQLSLEESNKIT